MSASWGYLKSLHNRELRSYPQVWKHILVDLVFFLTSCFFGKKSGILVFVFLVGGMGLTVKNLRRFQFKLCWVKQADLPSRIVKFRKKLVETNQSLHQKKLKNTGRFGNNCLENIYARVKEGFNKKVIAKKVNK